MFEKYRRTNSAEMRPYVEGEVLPESVSISAADRANGSPKLGDMIARNPESHEDQWLIAADYFAANFEPYDGVGERAEIERLRADAESCRKDAERMQEALAMIATATTEDGCTCDNGYTPMWMAEEALTATLQEKRTPENMVLDRVRSAEQNR